MEKTRGDAYRQFGGIFLSREASVDALATRLAQLTGPAWERGRLRPRCNVGSPVRRPVSWRRGISGNAHRGHKAHVPAPTPTPKINTRLRNARSIVCHNLRKWWWIFTHDFRKHDVLMVWGGHRCGPRQADEGTHLVARTPHHPRADGTPPNSC